MWKIGSKGESAGRRRFLRTVVATAGAAVVGRAAAGVSGPSSVERVEAGAAAPEAKTSAGYRETEHVRRYYETTRL